MVSYLPKLFVGAIVLILGGIIATAVSGRVRAALASEGVPGAGLAGRLTQWALMLIVVAFALEEMAIAPRTVQTALKIGMGSMGLIGVLAVGLGSRDAVARLWQSLLDTHPRGE